MMHYPTFTVNDEFRKLPSLRLLSTHGPRGFKSEETMTSSSEDVRVMGFGEKSFRSKRTSRTTTPPEFLHLRNPYDPAKIGPHLAFWVWGPHWRVPVLRALLTQRVGRFRDAYSEHTKEIA